MLARRLETGRRLGLRPGKLQHARVDREEGAKLEARGEVRVQADPLVRQGPGTNLAEVACCLVCQRFALSRGTCDHVAPARARQTPASGRATILEAKSHA